WWPGRGFSATTQSPAWARRRRASRKKSQVGRARAPTEPNYSISERQNVYSRRGMPFPVSCPACGKSFSIADEAYEQKIKGRVVSVKCKQCQALIRVDGTRPPPTAPSAAANAPERAATGSADTVVFLVDTPGSSDRELTVKQIADEIRAGTINETTLVWREGMPEWAEAGKVPELAPLLRPDAAPRPAKIRPIQPTL